LFKIIPVKKQGKYNLNVQLQDLGINIFLMKLGCLLSRDHRKAGLVDLLRVTNPLSAVNSTTPLDFRASGLAGSGSGFCLLQAQAQTGECTWNLEAG
jgi:hypothetical protein